MDNFVKQQKAFLKNAVKAIDNAPKHGSHTTYVPAENRVTKRKKEPKQRSEATSQQNAQNFSVMARIVDYMKKRHLTSSKWALTLQEILEEMSMFDLTKKTITWLEDALSSNPRLQVTPENEIVKYIYKPPLKISNGKTLVTFLKKYHADAKGALLLTELNDCIPNAAKTVEGLGNIVIDVPTQVRIHFCFARV